MKLWSLIGLLKCSPGFREVRISRFGFLGLGLAQRSWDFDGFWVDHSVRFGVG